MEDERGEAERVIPVEMGEENSLDGAGINAAAMHVRQKWRAAVQEQTPVHHYGAVVALRGECRARPQKS